MTCSQVHFDPVDRTGIFVELASGVELASCQLPTSFRVSDVEYSSW
ncbi:MAG: hypothetical protein F6K65_19180 [Moorea sp. SIO3C2]|nr:hypothetical protein [Moorena sp. SIO3C2]